MQRQLDSHSPPAGARESFAPSGDQARLARLAAVARERPHAVLGVLQYWLGPASQGSDSAEGADA